jgi:ABC-2 type transport system ATP-binding protein
MKRYGRGNALRNLSFTLAENSITGLIGRNGAGKTTLLSIIAGLQKQSSGEVRVFSENPFNNLKVSANTIFVHGNMTFPAAMTLKELLQTAGSFYHNWNNQLAERLLEYFSLDPSQNHNNLSKGMKSTFNMIVGLAARCPLTIFDEPTSGMDAGVRKDFYRALLKDYISSPRTIILSSHLLNEVEDILEDILLIKEGEKCLHMPVEDMKEYAIGISGPAAAVESWITEREIIHQQAAGVNGTYAVVRNVFSEEGLERARLQGLEMTPVSADSLCMYLTSKTKGGIDHVFS